MRLRRLSLRDFRCYRELELELAPGCTVVTGANGQGKTSLLEAIGWMATGRSFRGVPDAALVRAGAAEAIVRGEVTRADERTVLVEAAIRAVGRNRVLVNRQVLTRRRDLMESLRATVFAPDDLDLVKGGPALRRRYLDDLLEASAPRFAKVCSDYERVVRQRNALLRSGVRDAEARVTMEVLDERLVVIGGELVRGRLRIAAQLAPEVRRAYADLAGNSADFAARYETGWAQSPLDPDGVDEALRHAAVEHRRRELDRGITLVGPHRDDWMLELHGLDARAHASQGEQRTLALALRLAGHRVVAGIVGEEPLLLLDDVFSELDRSRSAALVAHLPATQTLLTTAGLVPEGVRPAATVHVDGGRHQVG